MPDDQDEISAHDSSGEEKAEVSRLLARVLHHHELRLRQLAMACAGADGITVRHVQLLQQEVDDLWKVPGFAALALQVPNEDKAQRRLRLKKLEDRITRHMARLARAAEGDLLEDK